MGLEMQGGNLKAADFECTIYVRGMSSSQAEPSRAEPHRRRCSCYYALVGDAANGEPQAVYLPSGVS